MPPVSIIGISGSTRVGSFNSALLRAAASSLREGALLRIESIASIPLYNGDEEAARGIPEAVARLKDAISGADGLLLVSPEYNNSLPGVAKNAIDWLSRPPADIPRVFGGKPVAIAGASPGGFGTVLSQNAWLPVFKSLGAELWSGGRLLVSRRKRLRCERGDPGPSGSRERARLRRGLRRLRVRAKAPAAGMKGTAKKPSAIVAATRSLRVSQTPGALRLVGEIRRCRSAPSRRSELRSLKKTRLVAPIIFALAAGVALGASSSTHAQATKPRPGAAQQSSAQPKLFDPKDIVILLLDHQTGLFQTVKDITIQELRTNTAALAKLATLAKIPVITTASEPGGPNGPLMPEIHQFAPGATYVTRKGEISAWDNADFVRTVRATGKKTLIIAGVWTSVCVAFPAIQAKADGYTVYAVIDASGDMSLMASQAALDRMTQAGIIPVTTNVIVTEVQRTWARPDAAQYADLYGEFAPHYRAVIESFIKAQEAARSK